MKRRILSALLSTAMAVSAFSAFTITADAAAKTPQYQEKERRMERLNRGLVAVKTEKDTREQTINGVVLSWRLLGDESLSNQAFDIYRDGTKIYTTGPHDATYYRDPNGTATSSYKVVKAGASAADVMAEDAVTPTTDYACAKGNEVGSGNSLPHSFGWVDIPISLPTDIPHANTSSKSVYTRTDGAGGANDASVGDLDGDGDYEIVLKWDPINSKDSNSTRTTGHCVIDAYEIDPNNDGYIWRIDLGNNIAAGAHFTQYIVYDFDGDGKAEVAMTTAPGTYSMGKDGVKHYVTEVGDTDEIRNADNSVTNLSRGDNNGPEYYTIFDGETGVPLKTTAAIPLGSANGSDYGDSSMNRSSRYLAGVAYLDGVNPSFIACRGYYNRAVIRAYTWDGEDFTMLWEHDGNKNDSSTMYGQGNHQLSIADIDNDGKDEIVWGSACLDDDGKTVLGNTRAGHGDAMHVSDFNNDGVQEVFSVKEKSAGYSRNTDFRVASTGSAIWSIYYKGDNGRGVMANIDDEYAKTHPDALSLGWSSAHSEAYDLKGNAVAAKPSGAGSGSFDNFLVYWDGDLSRELLDANIIQKYDAENGWTKRFYGPSDGYTLSGSTNNSTKRNYCLVADLWGDWREEIIMAVGDDNPETAALRIFTSLVPTEYRLTTLMHDCQYREAIAWQNVGYNQPPHPSYYIGSAALATDDDGNELNYLAPAVPFTKVSYPSMEKIAVEELDITEDHIEVDRGSSVSLTTVITPANASTKGINWESDNPAVATVSNGVVKGVSLGTATITATSKDTTNGIISDTCTVTVNYTPVTGISVPGYDNITVMEGGSKLISASALPSDATDKLINWTSSNENVATVDSGKVTSVGTGSAIITAETNDGGFSKDIVVTVIDGESTDKTGTDVFELAAPVSGTTLDNAGASSGQLTQKEAADGATAQRDFEVFSDNKVTLDLYFHNGGDSSVGDNATTENKWNWDGHEYNSGLKFLDTDGNNILTISQAFLTKAQMTQSTIGNEASQNIDSGWDIVVSGGNNPIGRSAAGCYITLEFDYDNDSCTATLASNREQTEYTYRKTFDLNGASFKTMQLYTEKNGDGTITAHPNFSELTYTYTVAAEGVGSSLYDKGNAATKGSAWSDSDASEWTLDGAGTASPELISTDYGTVFGYNPTKPGSAYSAEKTFDISDSALVTYDADWYFGSQTGANREHVEYLQIGSNLMLGWQKNYQMFLSTDGGATWSEEPIFTGSNVTFIKNVHVAMDTAAHTIKTVKFDGNVILSNYELPAADKMNSVKFGLIRNGASENWAYPNGLANLTVLEYVDGSEQPSTPEPAVTPEPTATPEPTPEPVTGEFKITQKQENTVGYSITADTDISGLTVIGAVYDGNALKAVKIGDTYPSIGAGITVTGNVVFDEAVGSNPVKLFAWDFDPSSATFMKPFFEAAE